MKLQTTTTKHPHTIALAAALEAMDELLTQTVDADLAYGIGLTEGESRARAKCLAVFAKWGPGYADHGNVEGNATCSSGAE